MKLKLLSVQTVAVETLISQTEVFPNSSEIINEWVDLIKVPSNCSPLEVCFDGMKYYLFDGYHRLEAMKRLGFNECHVIVHKGDRREALRRYIKDKLKGKYAYKQQHVFKHCIQILISDPVWSVLNDEELARLFDRKPVFFANLRIYASIAEDAHHYFCFKRNKHGTLDFGKRYPSMWR